MGSILSCISNILYLSEKITLMLTCVGLISSIIITFILSMGLGIGLGYNYCFVDLKTKYQYIPAHYKYPGSPRWIQKRGEAVFPTGTREEDDDEHRKPPDFPVDQHKGLVKVIRTNPLNIDQVSKAKALESNNFYKPVHKTSMEGNETTTKYMPSIPDDDIDSTSKSLPDATPESLPTSESLADTSPGLVLNMSLELLPHTTLESLPDTAPDSLPDTAPPESFPETTVESLPKAYIRFNTNDERTEFVDDYTETSTQMYDEYGDPIPSPDEENESHDFTDIQGRKLRYRLNKSKGETSRAEEIERYGKMTKKLKYRLNNPTVGLEIKG